MQPMRLLLIPIAAAVIGAFVYFFWPKKTVRVQFLCGVPANQINPFSLDTSTKLVYYHPWAWEKKVLKIYFVDLVDTTVINTLLGLTRKWSAVSGIKFKQTNLTSDSDIRVAFRQGGGYRSIVGSLADSLKATGNNSPTMWLADLDKQSQEEFARVVLHEFGHAIGLLHELQSRNSPINWDSAKVYAYFRKVYKLSEKLVNEQVLTPVKFGEATAFDPHSIMIYAIPDSLMKNHPTIDWPADLSSTDRRKIKLIYP